MLTIHIGNLVNTNHYMINAFLLLYKKIHKEMIIEYQYLLKQIKLTNNINHKGTKIRSRIMKLLLLIILRVLILIIIPNRN